MLRSNLCDYSDIYIFVKGRMLVDGTAEPNEKNENLTFRINAAFRSCISKIRQKILILLYPGIICLNIVAIIL